VGVRGVKEGGQKGSVALPMRASLANLALHRIAARWRF